MARQGQSGRGEARQRSSGMGGRPGARRGWARQERHSQDSHGTADRAVARLGREKMDELEKVETAEAMQQAAEIRASLASLARRDGVLTAEAVLEEAQPETSPLHRLFTWDNEEAGHQYRLFQARLLIRRVRVTVEQQPERRVAVQAHHRARPGEGEVVVMTPPPVDGFRYVLMLQARREIQLLRRRYQPLLDFNALLREELARVVIDDGEEGLGREGVSAV